MTHPYRDICDKCIRIFGAIQRDLLEMAWTDPDRAFEPVVLQSQQKSVVAADVVAEWKASGMIRRNLASFNPMVVGEESRARCTYPPSEHPGVVFLVDALDGSRLFEYGFAEWCSAVTAFDAATRRIVAAVVSFPSGLSYFATPDGAGKCRRRGSRIQYGPVDGPTSEQDSARAAIAFYGYKVQRLLQMRARLRSSWNEVSPRVDAKANVFVVGGNPALVRMIDGHRRIDAVIEPFGQDLHDMVAGAYICRQAGGTVIGLDGNALDLNGLFLEAWSRKVTFIAAGSTQLAAQLQRELGSTAARTPLTRSDEHVEVRACA